MLSISSIIKVFLLFGFDLLTCIMNDLYLEVDLLNPPRNIFDEFTLTTLISSVSLPPAILEKVSIYC
ncbi:MAG: hypothetical protein ABDH21_03100 [bacterium]